MTLLIEQKDVDRFRTIVTKQFGLQFDESKFDFLVDIMRQRMEVTRRRHFAEYADFLLSLSGRTELRALAEHVTVGETFFFRSPDNFRAFTESVLPARVEANALTRRLRILSAGCASGEEPYTIAIQLRETLPDFASWDVQIVGIDVNPVMLAKAAQGRYTSWSLRGTPADAVARYFQRDGRDFVLDPEIRKLVTFHERNLMDEDAMFWRPHTFDVIFCRNVLMYFTPEFMQHVVKRFSRSLAPGGFFFLGHAETLRGVSQDFHLCHTHDTFYYQVRSESDVPVHSENLWQTPGQPEENALPVTLDPMAPWADIIQQASARIAALRYDRVHAGETARVVESPESVITQSVITRAWSLDLALDAMRREQFTDALNHLSALPPDAHEEPDALLLRAALLVSSGRLDDAANTCRQLIALDEFNAGAYYLMALCSEHSGDLAAATEHDRFAIYLDPDFAMPHLHLGLLSRRQGNVDEARGELTRAFELLAREDPSRLLLFGGGFSRKALLQLCTASLRAAGAAQ